MGKNFPPWLKYAAGLGLLALLLLHPLTRPVIVWLLPLGSGWDDLVAIVALILAGLLIYFGSFQAFFAFLRNRRQYSNQDVSNWLKGAMIVAGVTALLLFLPITRPIVLFILPLGSGVDDLIFFLAIGAFFFFGFIRGWISIPNFFSRRKDR